MLLWQVLDGTLQSQQMHSSMQPLLEFPSAFYDKMSKDPLHEGVKSQSRGLEP
jgi:hypothetical protein